MATALKNERAYRQLWRIGETLGGQETHC